MTKPLSPTTHHVHAPEPESLAELRQDCTLVPERWTTASEPDGDHRAKATPAQLHGIRVPERSARLLDGMSDYGD